MELFVVIPYVNESSKYIWWEDHFESLPVFLHRVKETETSKAVKLEFMLDFNIFLWIIKVLFCFAFIDCWAMIHQNLANNMSSIKSNLDVISIVQRQICESCEY